MRKEPPEGGPRSALGFLVDLRGLQSGSLSHRPRATVRRLGADDVRALRWVAVVACPVTPAVCDARDSLDSEIAIPEGAATSDRCRRALDIYAIVPGCNRLVSHDSRLLRVRIDFDAVEAGVFDAVQAH
jgi:hypothetical protein